MPYYLQYLKEFEAKGYTRISAPLIAEIFGYTEIQVRKDLAAVSSVPGRPRLGFDIKLLISDIEEILGYKSPNKAIIVGVGSLGHALLNFEGFSNYGIDIIAAFDSNKDKIGSTVNGKKVQSTEKLSSFCKKNKIKIGIITVPQKAAQEVCNEMVEAGITAIWNFTQGHLIVPEEILVQNENMAANLAMLINHLKENRLEIGKRKKGRNPIIPR